MNKSIEKGMQFYDESNGIYYTTISHGIDQKCWECEQLEIDDNGEFESTGRVLLMERELKHMMEVH